MPNDTFIHGWQISPDLIMQMRQLIREGWTSPPKKFQFPKELDCETACLVYSAATELGMVEYEHLWKLHVAKLKREKVLTVEALEFIPDEKLTRNWSFPEQLVIKMRKLLE